jgi:ribonuclease P protein component
VISAEKTECSALTDRQRFITISNSTLAGKELYNEKDVPAQQEKKKKEPWFSGAHEDQGRTTGHQEQTAEGQNKAFRLMSETLPPQERIRKKKEFLFLYKKGNRYRGRYFTLIYLINDLSYSRMAVVASKKIGRAVVRNKVKRRLRTLYRRNKHMLQKNLDLVIIARKEAHEVPWQVLKDDYIAALQSIGQN